MEEQLKDLCRAENSTFSRLLLNIIGYGENINRITKEQVISAKINMQCLDKQSALAMIDIGELQHETTKLLSCISEYNTRLLWQTAVKRIIE